jgi:hypothetical protein
MYTEVNLSSEAIANFRAVLADLPPYDPNNPVFNLPDLTGKVVRDYGPIHKFESIDRMKTKTTVQALLNVLVGRDPNEEIIIEDNQLRVVSTVDLLSERPMPGGKQTHSFPTTTFIRDAIREQLPKAICNADTKTDPELRALVNQPLATSVKVETRGRPRKPAGAPKSPYTTKASKPVKPAKGIDNARRAWKPEDIKTMAALRENGASFEDIGKVFGRSGKAIECQLNYLRNPRPKPPAPVSNSVPLM